MSDLAIWPAHVALDFPSKTPGKKYCLYGQPCSKAQPLKAKEDGRCLRITGWAAVHDGRSSKILSLPFSKEREGRRQDLAGEMLQGSESSDKRPAAEESGEDDNWQGKLARDQVLPTGE